MTADKGVRTDGQSRDGELSDDSFEDLLLALLHSVGTHNLGVPTSVPVTGRPERSGCEGRARVGWADSGARAGRPVGPSPAQQVAYRSRPAARSQRSCGARA